MCEKKNKKEHIYYLEKGKRETLKKLVRMKEGWTDRVLRPILWEF